MKDRCLSRVALAILDAEGRSVTILWPSSVKCYLPKNSFVRKFDFLGSDASRNMSNVSFQNSHCCNRTFNFLAHFSEILFIRDVRPCAFCLNATRMISTEECRFFRNLISIEVMHFET